MNAQMKHQLEQRVEAFARDVVEILQSAVAGAINDALVSGAARGALAGAGRSSGAVVRGENGRKLSARSLKIRDDADRLLGVIKKKANQRIEQIATELGVPSKSLQAPVRLLLKEKKVKRAGQARGTTYRAA
jgi:hypothetical protein